MKRRLRALYWRGILVTLAMALAATAVAAKLNTSLCEKAEPLTILPGSYKESDRFLDMPGNKILPFGDLATIGFFIAIAVAVHKGNLFRTLISGSAIMAMTIWITNQTVAWTTALGTSVGAIEKGAQLAAMDQGGCPITYIFVQLFTRENIMGLIAIGAMYVVCMFFAVMHSRQRAIEVAANRDEDDE